MKILVYLLPLIIATHTLIGCTQSAKELPKKDVETVTQTAVETAPTETLAPVENTAPKTDAAAKIPQTEVEKPDQTTPTETLEQVAASLLKKVNL